MYPKINNIYKNKFFVLFIEANSPKKSLFNNSSQMLHIYIDIHI